MVFKLNTALVAGLSLALCSSAGAEPLLWQDDFGAEIVELTGLDDAFTEHELGVAFPYAGGSYTGGFIGTNGALALGGIGRSFTWPGGNEFINTPDPMVAPFWSDLSLEANGRVYQNNLVDRTVFTWENVGSFLRPTASFTFQVQLLDSGTIIFGYDGMDPIAGNLDLNAYVGVTEGNQSSFPPEVDYSAGVAAAGATVYERFDYNPPEVFDLDQSNIIFTPAGSAFAITTITAIPEPAGVGLSLLGISTLLTRRRR